MTRRKKVVGCFLFALIPLCSCCVWVSQPHPLSCHDRDGIKIGMTSEEGRAILGNQKKEDKRDEEFSWYYDCGPFSLSSPIDVWFDKNGRVTYVYIVD